jgi:hypothetical protein
MHTRLHSLGSLGRDHRGAVQDRRPLGFVATQPGAQLHRRDEAVELKMRPAAPLGQVLQLGPDRRLDDDGAFYQGQRRTLEVLGARALSRTCPAAPAFACAAWPAVAIGRRVQTNDQ